MPVFRTPPVVRVKDGNELPRRYFNLPEKQFLFLTTCDTASVWERKNPEGTLAAFKKAFAPNDKSVGLVLKISGPSRASGFGSLVQKVGGRNRRRHLELLKEQIEGYDNIRLIDRILTPEELRSLLKVTDCYVSLHRSEGFGLVPAEAMSLGKPVIITRWSGNTDYMTDDNSVGINYQLLKLGQDYGPYQADQRWAEPDTDQCPTDEKLAGDRLWQQQLGGGDSKQYKRFRRKQSAGQPGALASSEAEVRGSFRAPRMARLYH